MKKWETKSGYSVIQLVSGRSNVFLLTDGKKNILIDTSTTYMWKLLVKRLKSLNITHIDYLILTHSHSDHCENAHRIKEVYNALIIVHEKEATCLNEGKCIIPEGTNIITRTIVKLLAKRFAFAYRYAPCGYDFLVKDNFSLKDIGFNAYVLHTPGHTAGSVSIIVDDEIALVGDTMFGVFRWSVFPPYAMDVMQMAESWGKLLETGCTVFLPSHGSANERALVQRDYNKRIAQQ